MKVSPRKNVVPYALGVGALTLATAIGVLIYWNHLPAGGGFWGLQSETMSDAYLDPQPLPPETQSANTDGDPGFTDSERTPSTAAPVLPKSAAASGTDPDVILLSGEVQFDGDATNNSGVAVTNVGNANPSNGGAPAAVGLPALGGTVGGGIPNSALATGPGSLASGPISGPNVTGPSPGRKSVNIPPGAEPSSTPAPQITPPTNPIAGLPGASAGPTGGPVGSPTSSASPQAPSTGTPAAASGPSSPTVIAAGQTPQNPIVPISTMPNGAETLPVGAGHAWQFFDPPVAIGYNYELKPSVSGQTLTFGVTNIMVTTKVGSGVYDLWLYDVFQKAYVDASKFTPTSQEVTITADPTANPNGAFDVVKFLSSLSAQQDKELGITNLDLGLTQFSIRGIDPSAGLDPENPNAFITGLLFGGDINGNLFITPLAIDSKTGLPIDPPTAEVVLPEPTSFVLFATALALLAVLLALRAAPAKNFTV